MSRQNVFRTNNPRKSVLNMEDDQVRAKYEAEL